MKGNRGGTVLIVNDFRYHKHKTTGQSIHWRCWRTECRARVDTDIFDAQGDNPQIHPRNFQNHSHPVETELIHKNKFREAAVLGCVSMFRCTDVQKYRCSDVSMFRCTDVQKKCTYVQKKCTYVQMYRCSEKVYRCSEKVYLCSEKKKL